MKRLYVVQVIQSRAAGNPEAASIYKNLSQVNSSKINLEERLNNLELKTKANCFQGLLTQFGGARGFATKFYNPTVSRDLNDEADNAFAGTIVKEISKNGDLDSLVSAIEEAQKDGLNDKKVFMPENSFSVNGVTYGASSPIQAASLVNIFAENCKKDFKYKKNADGVTTAQLIKDLRKYGAKRDQMRKQAPAKIQSMLKNEIVNCTSDKSTGVKKMSCSNNDLNTGSSSFCIRTAKLCATNMNGCVAKAKSIVKVAKDTQAANAKTYDDTFKAVRLAMSDELSKLETFFEGQARSVDGKLNIMHNPPLKLITINQQNPKTKKCITLNPFSSTARLPYLFSKYSIT